MDRNQKAQSCKFLNLVFKIQFKYFECLNLQILLILLKTFIFYKNQLSNLMKKKKNIQIQKISS